MMLKGTRAMRRADEVGGEKGDKQGLAKAYAQFPGSLAGASGGGGDRSKGRVYGFLLIGQATWQAKVRSDAMLHGDRNPEALAANGR